MRVLVCGDRHWQDKACIALALDALGERPTLLIHGGAPGADTLAGELADERGIPKLVFPAKWGAFGKAAGPIRNREMLAIGKPELVLAFHSDLGKSRGTKDMLAVVKKAGVPIRHYTGIEQAVIL